MAYAFDFGPTEPSSVHEALAFAEELADAARLVAMRHFRRPLEIVAWDHDRPVTIADSGIEQMLRRLIGERYPEHVVFGARRVARERATWVLDPIDSTESFLAGSALFGTSIALVDDGHPVLGVIDLPALRERWTGTSGGTHFNGRPVWTSPQRTLAGARLYRTSRDAASADGLAAIELLARHADTRRFGGDCCAYGLLASGHCDLVVEDGLLPRDWMALVSVVEGAGGIITDWSGAPLGLESRGRVIAAATRPLHQEAIEVLASAPPARGSA